MIQLEKQVCALEQALKLKELGVKQDSFLYWRETVAGIALSVRHSEYDHISGLLKPIELECYSAFTCAELGVMLPEEYITVKSIHPGTGEVCFLMYKQVGLATKSSIEIGDTEAEARSNLLIYLLESNLITVEEINSKL